MTARPRFKWLRVGVGFALLVGCCGLATTAWAGGGGAWSRSKMPDKPVIDALAVDPAHPQVVYAAGFEYGLYKSGNGGRTWNSPIPSASIHALAIDPRRTETVFVGTVGGLYKSTDGTRTWHAVSRDGIESLAIDPQRPDTVYAGGLRLHKTIDGGRTWREVDKGVPPEDSTGLSMEVVALASDPAVPRIVYAATELGLFKTTTGGRNWTRLDIDSRHIHTLAIDPRNPKIVYVGAGTSSPRAHGIGVFKSTDGGRRWTPSNAGLQDLYVRALVLDPKHPTTVYVGTDHGGVFRSTNGGHSWKPFNRGLEIVERETSGMRIDSLAVSADGRFLHAGTDVGVFNASVGG